MRIGLLPPLEISGGTSGASAGTPGLLRPRPAATAPIRLFETDVTQPAIYGGNHVDLDHQ